MKIIWSPDLKCTPAFEWIEGGSKDELALVVYGNSITLTPGTVTLDVKNGSLLVHALDKESLEDLKKGEMASRARECIC